MVAYISNSSTRRLRQEDHEFEASLKTLFQQQQQKKHQ
jgi:hypothetical protein